MQLGNISKKKKIAALVSLILLAISVPVTILVYQRLADSEDISRTEGEAASWTINDLTIEHGTTNTVIDHSQEACTSDDIPDAPPDAFIDSNNKVQIISSHHTSYRNIGDNLDSTTHDCSTPLLVSHKDPIPRMYNDYEWLMSPYTLNGKDIYALIHTEYHGWEHNNCNSTDNMNCWWNSVNFASSTNSGATYSHTPAPTHNILNTNSDYNPANTYGAVGLINPSNIIKKGDYYYFFVTNRNPISQRSGICISRSSNIADPESWRLWDGAGFTLQGDHVDCPTLSYGVITQSVTYNTYLEKYLALQCHWGSCWISISDDLITWTPRRDFGNFCMYSSFIQPGDPTRNFELTGRSPWIYYMNCSNCGDCTMDRDLVRTRIRFTKPGDENKYEQLDLQFNERLGNQALDSSFYTNNASISGTHTWKQDSGKLYLNVVSDTYLAVPHKDSLNASGNITIKGEIRVSQKPPLGKFATIVSKENTEKRNYALFLNEEGKLHFSINDGTGYKGTLSNRIIADGQWHTFTVTFSDSTKKANYFIDGVFDVSTTINASLQNSQNTAPVRVGAANFQGDIDSITILNYITVNPPACTPSCTGKECGPDGCGGSCGTCSTGETCNSSGICVTETPPCTPSCTGKECGPDGCGGSCGTCSTGETCNSSGICVTETAPCTPSCTGKECGPDGCGGSCGTCSTGETCNSSGICVTETAPCTPSCTGKECGPDGCGGSCGTCSTGETCNTSGICITETSSVADIDGNGVVNIADYSIFVQDYLTFRNEDELEERSDLNNDGKISIADYAVFVGEYLKARQ